jgi:6-bladed beta-propeller
LCSRAAIEYNDPETDNMRLMIYLCFSFFAFITACSSGADRSASTVRDSAGIVIVETARASDTEYWTVRQLLSIGPDSSAADTGVFGSIGGVTADAQGRIYVLDQQAQQVRVFAPDGKLVRALGRPGKGPGELSRFANGLLVAHDGSVWVPDYAQARINAYSPDDSSEVNTIPLVNRPGGRSWVLRGNDTLTYRAASITRDSVGRFRMWDGVVRTIAGSTALDTLLVFDYTPTEIGAPPNLRIPLIMNAALWALLPDGRLVSSSLDCEFIRIHKPDGSIERIVRNSEWTRAPLTQSDRTALKELLRQKLTLLGGDPTAAQSPNVEVWDRWPAITAVRAGPDNTIWVQRRGTIADIDAMAVNSPDTPERFGGGHWDVLDSFGMSLGFVRFPAGFRPYDVRESQIYGVSTDSVGVQRVRVLELARPN